MLLVNDGAYRPLARSVDNLGLHFHLLSCDVKTNRGTIEADFESKPVLELAEKLLSAIAPATPRTPRRSAVCFGVG